MTIELSNEKIEELAGLNNIEKNMLKTRNNGLLLTDNQIEILRRNNINPDECNSMNELIFLIEEAIEDSNDENYNELDSLSEELATRNYYQNTKK